MSTIYFDLTEEESEQLAIERYMWPSRELTKEEELAVIEAEKFIEEMQNNPDNIIPHDDGCVMYLEVEVSTAPLDPRWQKHVL